MLRYARFTTSRLLNFLLILCHCGALFRLLHSTPLPHPCLYANWGRRRRRLINHCVMHMRAPTRGPRGVLVMRKAMSVFFQLFSALNCQLDFNYALPIRLVRQ